MSSIPKSRERERRASGRMTGGKKRQGAIGIRQKSGSPRQLAPSFAGLDQQRASREDGSRGGCSPNRRTEQGDAPGQPEEERGLRVRTYPAGSPSAAPKRRKKEHAPELPPPPPPPRAAPSEAARPPSRILPSLPDYPDARGLGRFRCWQRRTSLSILQAMPGPATSTTCPAPTAPNSAKPRRPKPTDRSPALAIGARSSRTATPIGAPGRGNNSAFEGCGEGNESGAGSALRGPRSARAPGKAGAEDLALGMARLLPPVSDIVLGGLYRLYLQLMGRCPVFCPGPHSFLLSHYWPYGG